MSIVLPPNQMLAAPGKWPVVGEKAPRTSTTPWTVAIGGAVGRPRVFSMPELLAMPRVSRVIDIHCVTRWSRLGARFDGVLLDDLLRACEPLAGARFASFVARSDRDHSTSLPLSDAVALGTLVAFAHEGEPLDEIHGGPVRTIVPGRYFYKSLKWLERIDLLAEDRLGYWEAEAGYHNGADPALEQRYMASTLSSRETMRVLEARDFSGRDLRGIDADHRELDGLNGRGALLRDARFRRASLRNACFDGANLSNAHLQGADLRGATFLAGDLEGADFCGADLRGADLGEASLFGTTFCPEADGDPWGPAVIDGTTRVAPAAIAALGSVQAAFVLRALGMS